MDKQKKTHGNAGARRYEIAPQDKGVPIEFRPKWWNTYQRPVGGYSVAVREDQRKNREDQS
jgi:hypothetical protein